MDIYLYYTIRIADAPLAQAHALALHRQLVNSYGIGASLKRRQQDNDGLQTWMEIYLDVPTGFGSVIEQGAIECGLAALAQNGRHIEYFEDMPACA